MICFSNSKRIVSKASNQPKSVRFCLARLILSKLTDSWVVSIFFQLFKVRIIHSAEFVSGTSRKRNICLKINNSLALWLWDHPMWILFPWIIYKWINNKPFQFLSARPHPTVGCGLCCMILYLYKQQNNPCYEFRIWILKIQILYMLGVSIINEIQKLKRKFQISLHFMLQDPRCKKQLILY